MSIPFPRKLVDIAPAVATVVDTSAYASGDAIGGVQTLNNCLRMQGNSGTLKKIVVTDMAKQKPALKLLFFSKTFTPSTDNAAFDLADAEKALFLGFVPIATTDWVDLNDNSVGVTLPGNGQGIDFKSQYGRSLYVQIVSAGTPTFVAASDLQFVFEFETD